MELAAIVKNLRPYFLMVLLQIGYAGIHIISVATLKNGMSRYILVVYRNIVAAAAVAPFALWFDRKNRPKLSIVIFLKIMAMALMEVVLDQNLYYIGAKLTSASFAAALIKIPAIPFIMALVLRIEKLSLMERSHQAKILGNLVTVVGAAVMIFYKGPRIAFFWSKGQSQTAKADAGHDSADWLMGALALLASAVFYSGFIFLQSNTLETYPANLSLTTLICLMGTLMSTVVALVAERGNAKAWSIGWDTMLLASVYSGILCTGVAYYVQGVVMKERDAVFVTGFNPLCMVIVVFLGSIILAEVITLGRLLGMIIIVGGLYFFIWGKSKDHVPPSSFDDANANEMLELPKYKSGERIFTSTDSNTVVMDIPATETNSENDDDNFASTKLSTTIAGVPVNQTT